MKVLTYINVLTFYKNMSAVIILMRIDKIGLTCWLN